MPEIHKEEVVSSSTSSYSSTHIQSSSTSSFSKKVITTSSAGGPEEKTSFASSAGQSTSVYSQGGGPVQVCQCLQALF